MYAYITGTIDAPVSILEDGKVKAIIIEEVEENPSGATENPQRKIHLMSTKRSHQAMAELAIEGEYVVVSGYYKDWITYEQEPIIHRNLYVTQIRPQEPKRSQQDRPAGAPVPPQPSTPSMPSQDHLPPDPTLPSTNYHPIPQPMPAQTMSAGLPAAGSSVGSTATRPFKPGQLRGETEDDLNQEHLLPE